MKNCHECQKEVSSTADSCPHCGARYNISTRTPIGPAKSRGTAVALAIFLGGIGAHKFYLGRPGWGVAYLLFCWTLIPAILGVLEGIAFLSESNSSFQKRYCGA